MNLLPACSQTELAQLEDLRGMPLIVGTYEEYIDDHHAIVTSHGGAHDEYVTVCSFVDRDLLILGCRVLLHNKVQGPLRVEYLESTATQYYFLV